MIAHLSRVTVLNFGLERSHYKLHPMSMTTVLSENRFPLSAAAEKCSPYHEWGYDFPPSGLGISLASRICSPANAISNPLKMAS
jgi:hypothetical protein